MPQAGGPINVPKKRKPKVGRLLQMPKEIPAKKVTKARKIMKKRTYKAK